MQQILKNVEMATAASGAALAISTHVQWLFLHNKFELIKG
jgi:hypothetical protein